MIRELFQDDCSFEDEFLISDREGGGGWRGLLFPAVRAVTQSNWLRGRRNPLFKVFGSLLNLRDFPAAFMNKNIKGFFVEGGPDEVKKFANHVGGILVRGPEKHGKGKNHYHLKIKGKTHHVWYDGTFPPGDFYE